MIRVGESGGARRARGLARRGRPRRAGEARRRGTGKTAELDGTRLPVGRVAPPRVPDARLHAGPARGREGRARRCGAPTSTASLARLLPPQARAPAGLRGGARPAERRAPARPARALAARRRRAVDGARRRPRRRRWSRPAARPRPPLEPGFREHLAKLRASGRPLSYEGEPPSVEALEAPPRRRRRARDDRPRAAPRRPRRSPPAASFADSARRESSGWPCSRSSSPRPSCSRPPPLAAARRRPLGARRAPPRRPRRGDRGARADRDHGDARARRCPASRPGRGGEPVERLSDAVRGELCPLRAAGRPRRDRRALAGRRRRGDRAERVARADRPRRHRCTSTRPTRCGPSSSPTAGRRSPRGSASRRSASPRGRWPAERHRHPSRSTFEPTPGASSARRPRSRRRRATKTCAKRIEKSGRA